MVLSAFGNRHIAAQQTGISCGSYKQWRLYFDRFPKDSVAGSDMIAINGNAVLRLRSSAGAITRHVLSGTDPTSFSIDGIPFEILIVSGRPFRSLREIAQFRERYHLLSM